ncbi:uncharacterized protein [Dermacentor andersoni]|uniref:uncharacterized protein n=1 Tax=Dermacentor andersoni TaxID=34620 RepID=UPI003B3B9382
MSKRRVYPSLGGDSKKPCPTCSMLSTRAAESYVHSYISEGDLEEARSSSGTTPKQSPVKRRRVPPSQAGDRKKPCPTWSRLSTRAAESHSYISERDLDEPGSSSGTTPKQCPVKSPSPKQGGDDAKHRSPGTPLSSTAAIAQRPGWLSERDWREAGSCSGTKRSHSPAKRLGPGSRHAKMARLERRTDAVTVTAVPEIPGLRSSSRDVYWQGKALANLSLSDAESKHEVDQRGLRIAADIREGGGALLRS